MRFAGKIISLMSTILVFLTVQIINIYKRFISPLLPQACRFYPTCSEYSVEAVKRFGFFRGGYLSVKRILSCNPLCKGGVDPVPEKFRFWK